MMQVYKFLKAIGSFTSLRDFKQQHLQVTVQTCELTYTLVGTSSAKNYGPSESEVYYLV